MSRWAGQFQSVHGDDASYDYFECFQATLNDMEGTLIRMLERGAKGITANHEMKVNCAFFSAAGNAVGGTLC